MKGAFIRTRGEELGFHYGFLSSNASRALNEYISKGTVSKDSIEALEEASHFLEEVLAAQDVFRGERKRSVVDDKLSLGAYKCALDVVIKHRNEFQVSTPSALVDLFVGLNRTVTTLAKRDRVSAIGADRARKFFVHFAELMLAQISLPKRPHSASSFWPN